MNDIITQGNVATIIAAAPTALEDNRTSMQRCSEYGSNLVKTIQQTGMSKEMDEMCAKYVERSRKTVDKMRERRSEVTRLFDSIRGEFTALENAIDPGKAGTIPNVVKRYRDEFAAEEHRRMAEAAAQRRMEAERKNAIEAKRMEIVNSISEQFKRCHAMLKQFFENIANDSRFAAADKLSRIEQFESLEAKFNPVLDVQPDVYVDMDTLKRIYGEVCSTMLVKYREEIVLVAEELKSRYVSALRNASEAQKTTQVSVSDASATRVAEIEQAEKQKSEVLSAFISAQAGDEQAKANTKVSYRIELLDQKGILPIISEWWTREGVNLPVEEIMKLFRKQLTFMERLAKKEGYKVNDPNVVYNEEVKAR